MCKKEKQTNHRYVLNIDVKKKSRNGIILVWFSRVDISCSFATTLGIKMLQFFFCNSDDKHWKKTLHILSLFFDNWHENRRHKSDNTLSRFVCIHRDYVIFCKSLSKELNKKKTLTKVETDVRAVLWIQICTSTISFLDVDVYFRFQCSNSLQFVLSLAPVPKLARKFIAGS